MFANHVPGKDNYWEYMEKSQKPTVEKQITQLENGKKLWTYTPPKKTDMWQIKHMKTLHH